uniref:Transposon protein, putative, Pong sub-class n=1 Tax=Oryza sativa subsp. japonica TaxID=39947 RepID=Q2QVK4_ORYSJ|nr:transposon protein, putative, Pong sub-class [Oryza sativa Japonica Group]
MEPHEDDDFLEADDFEVFTVEELLAEDEIIEELPAEEFKAAGVIEKFGDEYLRLPRADELEKILQENEARGFPGMYGSIDSIKGEAPTVHYNVNGTQYDMGYYLADRIYPEWAVFVKTVTAPQLAEDKLFALKQEGARKDVECAFGVLQSCFDIIRRPARLWKQGDVINIMQACVILHNMIVEDEKEAIRDVLDLNYNPSATIVLPPEVQRSDNPDPCFTEVLRRNSAIKARPTHRKLKKDLIEHIWQRYGNKEN